MWEAMVGELRAKQVDINARRHFTPEKEPIRDTREVIEEWVNPAPPRPVHEVATATASSMRSAAESGLIEVG
jgi:hypothetical protein